LGGSDSHVPYTVGQAFTWFPGRSAADLRRAVLARRTRAGGSLWTPTSLLAAMPLLRGAGLPAYEHTHVYGDEPAALDDQTITQPGATRPRPAWVEFSQKP
jgi:hypothetical protein